MLLQTLHEGFVFGEYHIDCCSFTAETASTTDSVDLVFLVCWQFLVDHQVALLNVDSTRQQVSGDHDAGDCVAEVVHNHGAVTLVQVGVDHTNLEFVLAQILGQNLSLLLGVYVDDAKPDINLFK